MCLSGGIAAVNRESYCGERKSSTVAGLENFALLGGEKSGERRSSQLAVICLYQGKIGLGRTQSKCLSNSAFTLKWYHKADLDYEAFK